MAGSRLLEIIKVNYLYFLVFSASDDKVSFGRDIHVVDSGFMNFDAVLEDEFSVPDLEVTILSS